MAHAVPGSLHIATDVIADIAGLTALESYGVVGMAGPLLRDGIATLLPRTKLRKGVDVKFGAEGARVDLYVIVEHGVNIATVAKNLEDTLTFMIHDLTDVPLEAVVVHVQGVKVREK